MRLPSAPAPARAAPPRAPPAPLPYTEEEPAPAPAPGMRIAPAPAPRPARRGPYDRQFYVELARPEAAAAREPSAPDERVARRMAEAVELALRGAHAALLALLEPSLAAELGAHGRMQAVPMLGAAAADVERELQRRFAQLARLARAVGRARDAPSEHEARGRVLATVMPHALRTQRPLVVAVAPWLEPTLLARELGEASGGGGVRALAYAMYEALQERSPRLHLAWHEGRWELVVHARYDGGWRDVHALRLTAHKRTLELDLATGVRRLRVRALRLYMLHVRRLGAIEALYLAMHMMRTVGATPVVPNTQAVAELRSDAQLAALLPVIQSPFERAFVKYHEELALFARRGLLTGTGLAAYYGRSIMCMLRTYGVEGELEVEAGALCALLMPADQHYRVADYERDVRPLLEELRAQALDELPAATKALVYLLADVDDVGMRSALLDPTTLGLIQPTLLAYRAVELLRQAGKVDATMGRLLLSDVDLVGLPLLLGDADDKADDTAETEPAHRPHGKAAALYWMLAASYDRVHRERAVAIGERYERHVQFALNGVSDALGVHAVHGAARPDPTASERVAALPDPLAGVFPLHAVPIGACVYAQALGSEARLVWRRAAADRFDQYTVRPLDSSLVLSKNRSVTYAELQNRIHDGAVRGLRGPLYDPAELTAGEAVRGTLTVVAGAASPTLASLDFRPARIVSAATVRRAHYKALAQFVRRSEASFMARMHATVRRNSTGTGLAAASVVGLAAAASVTGMVGLGIGAVAAGAVVGAGAAAGALATRLAPGLARRAEENLRWLYRVGTGLRSAVARNVLFATPSEGEYAAAYEFQNEATVAQQRILAPALNPNAPDPGPKAAPYDPRDMLPETLQRARQMMALGAALVAAREPKWGP